jgi:hypothetical protein
MARAVVAKVRERSAGRASLVMEVRIIVASGCGDVVLGGFNGSCFGVFGAGRQVGRLGWAACSGWSDRSYLGGELFEAHVTAALGPAFCRDGRLSGLWPEAATSTHNVVGSEGESIYILFSKDHYNLLYLSTTDAAW